MPSKPSSSSSSSLICFAPNIYIKEYPIQYAGCRFLGRMTVIKLLHSSNPSNGDDNNNKVLIHSPCEIDDELKWDIETNIGPVAYIVAPGTFHHLYVASCQKAFPSAKTYICPGLETKKPGLVYDGILVQDTTNKAEQQEASSLLSSSSLSPWSNDDLEQILIRGNRIISEVAFFHKPSQTLILVDAIEWIGEETPGINWVLKAYWHMLGMWNVPKPAPEYQMGWSDRKAARESLEKILEWDFTSVILAHGENMQDDAKFYVRQAWHGVLRPKSLPCYLC